MDQPSALHPQAIETVDVLIIGAGISGIAAARTLKHDRPTTSFTVLEAHESFGGTWHIHKYPGVRSDSDLFTFGYSFKPWRGAPVAPGSAILDYMGEVIRDDGLGPHIRYGHKVVRADWSGVANCWTVDVARSDGSEARFSARFLWMCQGYYRHDKGHVPEWPGMADFDGDLIHPQSWPEDLDYRGRRVIVVGSGATAATLVPAIAAQCASVTMLQRSPTYFSAARNRNDLYETLKALDIDPAWTHEIVRRQVLAEQRAFTQRCLDEPDRVKSDLFGVAARYISAEEIEKNFTPRYDPWQQRLAFIPDGDLFKCIAAGDARVVTDEIERFEAAGIRTKSGELIEADIVVAATGFDLNVMGDIAFFIDGRPLDFADTVTYRGMMFTGVPNLLWVFGYFRAAWTLRAEMVAEFLCRLLDKMDASGASRVDVRLRAEDEGMTLQPWFDTDKFHAGYVLRGQHLLPRRGAKAEWSHTQDYWTESEEFPRIDLDGPEFVYSSLPRPPV